MKTLAPPDPAGMRDYYDIYVKHEAELTERVMQIVDGIPALAQIVKQMSKAQLDAQTQQNRELLRKAVFEANWEPFTESQRRQGELYAQMDVPFRDWFELVGGFQKVLYPKLVEAYGKEPQRLSRALSAVSDYVDQTMGAIAQEYLKVKEKIINQQAEAIRELSTPVLQVRDRLLLIPIVGLLDTHRARSLTESLLSAIREHRAKVVVIDITGVAAVDSRVANHLFQTVAAAKLMGAHSIVTGLSADVAQALVVLGVDTSRLTTAGDLQSGLEEANLLLEGKAAHARSDSEAP